ncbi:hypothetical protein KAJ83_06710 [Marivibrio halodurans]|uniref:Uncharacterized protein n=1 Tax=Marivibrio halodurans TaxID=2039722 RepID=A0A8J7V2B1_9PROT|nr:hypothetical protein [Marivibrio halodurans]MBP5856692.1 hypothetical protein [Marivibrio halodurans]
MDMRATNKVSRNSEYDTLLHYRKSPIFLHYLHISCIKVPYYESFCNFIFRRDIMSALQDTFEEQSEGAHDISRRGALRSLALGGVAAFMLASLPGANDAQAGEAKAATPGERGLDAVQGMDDMAAYSRDPNKRGIGIFINVQGNAPDDYGDRIGQRLGEIFEGQGVPTEYRVNRSRGTTTDITFYVNGYNFTINIDDIKGNLGRVYAHYQDEWGPRQVSQNTPSQ